MTFLVLISPVSRSWRALRLELFKSNKLHNTASQALGTLETTPPVVLGSCRLRLLRCASSSCCAASAGL